MRNRRGIRSSAARSGYERRRAYPNEGVAGDDVQADLQQGTTRKIFCGCILFYIYMGIKKIVNKEYIFVGVSFYFILYLTFIL